MSIFLSAVKTMLIPYNFRFRFLRKPTVTHEYGAESNSPADSIREAEIYMHKSKGEQNPYTESHLSYKLVLLNCRAWLTTCKDR